MPASPLSHLVKHSVEPVLFFFAKHDYDGDAHDHTVEAHGAAHVVQVVNEGASGLTQADDDARPRHELVWLAAIGTPVALLARSTTFLCLSR
eukprot:CAMPEP_0185568020 /NCGR_PEP_ID=MMETSP0434-20130131/1110_1 /TAXON_ID=626734 ORGANISM="Favella taraikaensis, Strain Fe Narragansett Bay" /NCGR_SAMPLE_ID=MMETSP0434 /ASSEMBLY_ACC=CAM_ASM_000379 /LENGTH=91 /DNA_ID=CAMNT_0028182399 /DNA_START=742 /DNA_END=1014 /DNA_ORIENTATION=-